MKTDARNVAPGSTLSADLCIVGGGPVGISNALTASRLGLSVVLLESGDVSESDADTIALAHADSVGYPIQGMFWSPIQVSEFTQRQLGGGSNHFAGYCRPWKDEDYVGCPVSKAEMDPHYVDAHNYWGQGPYNYDPAYWAGVTGLSVPDFGPDLKFEVIQQRGQNFGYVYLQEMTDSTSLQLVHHANATNLNAAPGGGHVNTITVQTLSGVTFYVEATSFVLALGGTQTPRLMLMSNDVVAEGLGNQYDQVGRYYADHLASGLGFVYLRESIAELGLLAGASNVATTTPDGRPTATNILPALDMSAEASEALGYSMHLQWVAYDTTYLAQQASGVTPSHIRGFMQAGGGAPQTQLICRTFLKQQDNPNSRVSLSPTTVDAFGRPEPVVDWQPIAADSANRKAAMKYMAGLLDSSGKGLLHNTLNWAMPTHIDSTKPFPAWFEIDPSGDEPDPYHESCFHQMCTTRMGTDPSSSVVDADCKVHSVDNLYAAGPSVFHRGVGYTPTLNAIAFAVRLAKHLHQLTGGAAAGRQASAKQALSLATAPSATPTPLPGPLTGSQIEALLGSLAAGTIKDPWPVLVQLGLQQTHAPSTTTTTAMALPLIGAGLVSSKADKTQINPGVSQPQSGAPTRATYGRRDFMGRVLKGAVVVALVGGSAELLSGCVAIPWSEIIAMGQQYIARVPAEADHSTLSDLLGNPTEFDNPTTLLENLRSMIDADYPSAKTFEITGWCLSLTEWRICAWWATRPAPTTTTTA